MTNKQYLKAISFFSALALFSLSISTVLADEEEGTWDRAGREVKEAAGVVTEATMDTSRKAWQKTREESVAIWDKTREFTRETWKDVKEDSGEAWEYTRKESKEIFERAKSKIHEATAPEQEGEEHPK